MNDDGPPTGDAAERWQADRTTFERVYDVVSGVREPLSAAEFADLARCSTNGARRALDQLSEMGVVERRETRPVTYRRNDAYFTWRRVESLAEEYTAEELRARVADLVAEDREFQERYDAPTPDAVSTEDRPIADQDAVEGVWADLDEWRTVRRDVAVLRRAVRRANSGGGGTVRA